MQHSAEVLQCDLTTWDGKACEYSVRSKSAMNEHQVWSGRHGGCGASMQCKFCPSTDVPGQPANAFTTNNGFNKHVNSDKKVKCWGHPENRNYTGMPHRDHAPVVELENVQATIAHPIPPPTAPAPGDA